MCDTSMNSCDQGLYFVYLNLRPLNKLWGRYDPKTETLTSFLLVTMLFLHIEPSERPLSHALIIGFISSSYTGKLRAI